MTSTDSKQSFTPGPWVIKPIYWARDSNEPRRVAEFSLWPPGASGIKNPCDAALIEAAPRLYDALARFLKMFPCEHQQPTQGCVACEAKAALALNVPAMVEEPVNAA
jgi:hypothetical protein